MGTIASSQSDCIYAMASPEGTGAISLYRTSGPGVVRVLGPALKGKTALEDAEHGKSEVRWLVSPLSGERVDRVMAVVLRSPKTYTGEDMVEISTHGGSDVQRETMDLLTNLGLRTARAGEFTLRAFLNGKINLLQAEAVRDIVNARTREERRQAIFLMDPKGSQPLVNLRDKLEKWLMVMEAIIEFPEDNDGQWGKREFVGEMEEVSAEIGQLIENCRERQRIRAGLVVPIVGLPNAGKSSLFNYLCGRERVIVDHEAGTTRDAVEEELEIEGVRVCLVDTAGIRSTKGRVEAKGVAIAQGYLERADVALWVIDGSVKETGEEEKVAKALGSRDAIKVFNKMDLGSGRDGDGERVSLLSGEGAERLAKKFREKVRAHKEKAVAGSGMGSAHMAECLRLCGEHVANILNRAKMDGAMLEEIASEELRGAMGSLGPYVGFAGSEELLSRIFADFCVGK